MGRGVRENVGVLKTRWAESGLVTYRGEASQKCVALVQSGDHKCLIESLSGFSSEERTNSPDVIKNLGVVNWVGGVNSQWVSIIGDYGG